MKRENKIYIYVCVHTHTDIYKIKLITWTTACLTQWNYEPCRVGPPKMDGSWWRVLKKPWSTGEGNGKPLQYSCLRTPWTVWKGKKIGHWKMNSPDQQLPNMLLEISREITPEKNEAAAAAKSLQSCLTLCDPIDGSPRGSPVPGILQARTLEWVAISFSNAWRWKVKVKSLSRVRLLVTPWTAAHQAPPSMGFSRQEYWSGVPLPSARKNEETEPKWKQCSAVDVTGNGSKVQCCKEQYCIGTWNVRSTNQGKLQVVKQEMARKHRHFRHQWTKMDQNEWV